MSRRVKPHVAVLEPRPLTRAERHLVGDHRSCTIRCERQGHDDRFTPLHDYLRDKHQFLAWMREDPPTPFPLLSADLLYAIGLSARAEVRVLMERERRFIGEIR